MHRAQLLHLSTGEHLITDLTRHLRKTLRMFLAVSLLALSVGIGAGSLRAGTPANPLDKSASPIELVRATVANEVAASDDSNSIKHMFSDHKTTPQGSQTRIFVETRQAVAGITVAYNDEPLTPEQLQAEEGRLAGISDNPDQLARRQRQQKEDADRTLRIVKALPEAFLYAYDGTETGTATLGKTGNPLLRLKFLPNPDYHPPSHVEDVLIGMQGVLLIDPGARRIARIDGTLSKEVSFGWGILGHLDKGGHFLVEQRDVGDDSWEVSRMTLNFAGRILLFKSLSIRSDEVFSDFRRVPNDTTFAQGVEMLKAEEAKLAENHKSGSAATGPKAH
jgi:hypothetical protein